MAGTKRDMVFVKEEELKKDILSLTSASDLDFIILGYNDKDELEVVKKGTGNIATFKGVLKSDSVNYIFMGTAVAEGNYSVQKNVLITWVGTEVGPLFRSMSAHHRVLLYKLGNSVIQMHGEYQALHPDDLSDELLQQKLAGSRYVEAASSSELNAAHRARGGAGKVEKFEFEDEAAVKSAIQDIRAEKLNYLFFEHSDSGSLSLLHKGQGGYKEVEKFWDDKHVSYVLIGITLEDEGDYTQIKLVLVTWVGVGVEPMEKARSSQARVLLYDYIKSMVQLAGEFQALERSEISEKLICDKIALTKVGQKSEQELLRAAAEDAKKKEKREGTGLTKTEEKKEASNPFVNADEGAAAVLDFGDPKSETNWALFGYKEKSNDLYYLKKGTGKLDQYSDELKNDNLMYVLYGVVDITDGDYSTLKYMLIAWVGENVKPLHRARSAHHRVAIYQYASSVIPMHGELQVMTPSELSEENLRKKLIGTKILAEGDEEKAIAHMSHNRSHGGGASHDNAIVWQDPEGVKNAILSLRSDTDMVDFVVFGYTDDGKYTVILEKGKGGVSACRKHFKDDAVVFVVMSAVVPDGAYSVQKNILIAWVGPNVPPLARSRSSQNRVQLYQYATELIQLHGEIQALSAAEISDDLVTQKLSGSKYDKAGGENEEAAAHRTRSKKGQHFNFNIHNPDEFNDLLNQFRARKINWITLGYEGEDQSVRVLNKGEGGYSEVTSALKDDNLVYFLLGASPEDEGNYTQIKNILVTWVGPSVDPLHKGLSSQHRVALYQLIKKTVQLHGELQALNSNEISEQLIFEKLTLSKERNEDDLVACRLKDEQKAADKEKRERSQTSNAKYMFVSTAEVACPFQGDEEKTAKEAIGDVADETTQTNYIVFGYADNKTDLRVTEKGSGDVSAFNKYFTEDKIAYVLYGITFQDGDYSVIKRVLVTWVGQKVKPLHKARSSQHRAALYKYVNSLAVLTGEFHALSGQVSDVSDDLIRKKLEGTKILDESAKSDKGKGGLTVGGGSGRGFKKGESFQFKWEDESLVDKSIASLSKGEVTWVQFGNTKASNFLTVVASGKGDIEAISAQLKDADISYFLLAKDCPDQSVSGKEAGNYNVIRNVFINWVGPDVKPMVKARSSQHRVAVYSSLKQKIQLHGEIQLSAHDELTLDVVFDKLGVTGWRVS